MKAYGRAFCASGQGQITGACGGAFLAMTTESLRMPLGDNILRTTNGCAL